MEQKSYSPGKTGLVVQEGKREQEGQAVKGNMQQLLKGHVIMLNTGVCHC